MTRYAKVSFWAILFGLLTLPSYVFAASITETSAAIGEGCDASGENSTAMGYYTTASAPHATAMGFGSTASAYTSTAMGNYTTASGENSTAMGYSSEASAYTSTAMGYYTTASGNYSTVIGTGWNNAHRLINDSNRSFMVGYMSNESDTTPEFFVKDHGVGINTPDPLTSLHVKRAISAGAGLANHVAAIENTSTGTSADVLMLKVNTTNPGTYCNFITFSDGAGNIGAIEGNGEGGVKLTSPGGDFAEYLPKADPNETLTPGDIVGLFPEGLSKRTHHAQRIMVVSTAPAVLGNRPEDADASRYAPAAFLGQVPVRVVGAVRSGDYIVPSGRADGIGRAVSPAELTSAQYGAVVGRALETHLEEGVKGVTVLVGLPQDGFWSKAMEAKEARISELEGCLAALEARSANGSGLGLLPGAGIIMGSLGFFWMDRRRRRA